MASNLRVDSIVPATGSSVSIGTATGGVNIPGVLTYEDVTNVDSVGVITARSGINVSGGGVDITTGGLVVTGISTTTARLDVGNNGTNAVDLRFRSNRASAGQTIANLNYEWNGTTVAQIRGIAGSDTTNKDDGHLAFYTTPAGSGSFSERLRIGSAGQIGIAGANYGTSGQVLTSQGSGSAVQWATPSSGSMTLLATMSVNMSANTQSQSLNLTGYQKLMGTVTRLELSGGLNDTWFGFNNMTSSGNYSWYRSYLDNSNDTSAQHSANGTGYAYGSVGPGFFYNLAGIAGFDTVNNDAEFTLHNLQDGGRKIFTMTARGYNTRNMVINTSGSVEQTAAITSFQVNVAQSSHRLTGGTIKLYGFK